MLSITGPVQSIARVAKTETYAKRKEAIQAGVATLGPEARLGFEVDVHQRDDGRWAWKRTEEERPLTAMEARHSGLPWPKGKRQVGGVTYFPPAEANGHAVCDKASPAASTVESAVPQPAKPNGASKPPAKPAEVQDLPADLKRKPTPDTAAKVSKHVAADKARREGKGIKNPPSTKTAKKRKATREKGGKTALVGALLKRKEGCTTADILKLTGWPAVSVPQMSKANGLTLRKEKKPGEPTRYWGV